MEVHFTIFMFIGLWGFSYGSNFDELRKLITRNNTLNWLRTVELHNNTSPYCHLCCVNITSKTIGKICGSHTLCKFPDNSTGPTCKGYIDVLFTYIEQEAILDIHNTLRSKLAMGLESRGSPGPQPMASNMRVIEWDDELSLIAQRWAAQCIFAHDKCRDTDRYPVGQNIARGNLATNNELSLVEEWYEEVAKFNKDEVLNFEMPTEGTHVAGRYTQLIWADTYQVGCARAIFQQLHDSRVTYREHLICNYGPTGNIPNQPVYKIGDACSACPEGTARSMEYEGLCQSENSSGEIHKFAAKNASYIKKFSTALVVGVYIFYVLYLYSIIV